MSLGETVKSDSFYLKLVSSLPKESMWQRDSAWLKLQRTNKTFAPGQYHHFIAATNGRPFVYVCSHATSSSDCSKQRLEFTQSFIKSSHFLAKVAHLQLQRVRGLCMSFHAMSLVYTSPTSQCVTFNDAYTGLPTTVAIDLV